MRISIIVLISSFLFCASAAMCIAAPLPAPTGLMCDLLARPELVKIMDSHPRFTWVMNSDISDDYQTAYQIRVAASPQNLDSDNGSIWDSRKTASDNSVSVPFAKLDLKSDSVYWWKIRLWNREGRGSRWSAPQKITTGAIREASAPREGDRITTPCYPLVVTPKPPVSMVALGSGNYFVDFGKASFGSLALNLSSARGGDFVKVKMGEVLAGKNHINPNPGGSRRYFETELRLEAGTHAYRIDSGAQDARRMPKEIGAVMPFRYVEIENCSAPLSARAVVRNSVHYEFDDNAASFSSSNPKLNAIWELCKYSIKATSFCGIFVDGDRERTPYEADAYINELGYYACDREYTIARYSHEYLMTHATWPTEWQSFSVLNAWEDYMTTGDDRSLGEFYDDLKAKTLDALSNSEGLINTTTPAASTAFLASLHVGRISDIVDWPLSERDGYDMRPVNTVVNEFYYKSLVEMANIAEAVHNNNDAALYRKKAENTAKAINRVFFDAQTGLYVDGEGSSHSSLHANMFALAFGLVPGERRQKVANFVASKGMACSVYGAQFLLEALYDAGLGDKALELMVAPGDRSWRHMVEDVNTTITLEAWDDKYKPNEDWNHAWGAAPANIIPRKLMGIEPLLPGFRKIRIHPQLGSLSEASIATPTIRGTVRARVQQSPKSYSLTVDIPANMTAQVVFPRLGSKNAKLEVDGKVIAGYTVFENDFIFDAIGSGRHTITQVVP